MTSTDTYSGCLRALVSLVRAWAPGASDHAVRAMVPCADLVERAADLWAQAHALSSEAGAEQLAARKRQEAMALVWSGAAQESFDALDAALRRTVPPSVDAALLGATANALITARHGEPEELVRAGLLAMVAHLPTDAPSLDAAIRGALAHAPTVLREIEAASEARGELLADVVQWAASQRAWGEAPPTCGEA